MATLYDCAITTVDNPFDPFDQFNDWLMFDKEKGYHSCERVVRLAKFTDDMSEPEINEEFERAIDRLISLDCLDIFKKITRKAEDNESEAQNLPQ